MRWLTGPLAGSVLVAALAHAETPEPITEVSPTRLARAASLDIRGVVPSPEEMEQIALDGGLSLERLDEWLNSEAFVEQAVRHHRALLWNELSLNNLNNNRRIRRTNNIYFNGRAAEAHRGLRNEPCSDYEADVDADGIPLSWAENGGIRDEGWVWVTPYWSDEPVKVCAWDAQTTLITSSGADCSQRGAANNHECGCGPALQWCMTSSTNNDIVDAMERDLEHRVRDVIRRDAPYSEMLTNKTGMVNGPLAHFYRHLAAFNRNIGAPVFSDALPELSFMEKNNWVQITLPEYHSGVLTAPGWLLRHQTNRGRANRFYGAFLCREFVPPSGGIGGLEAGTPTPDLTMRDGCQSCHARLEPWAAYWGRWQEAGNTYLDPEDYPDFNEECERCAVTGRSCPQECREYYMVSLTHPDEDYFAGWMLPFAFLQPDQQAHPNMGPSDWVNSAAADGTLGRCAARNAAGWLLGDANTVPTEAIDGWAEDFETSGTSYRELYRTIVTSDVYGRVQ